MGKNVANHKPDSEKYKSQVRLNKISFGPTLVFGRVYGKIKFMFQTTNQFCFVYANCHIDGASPKVAPNQHMLIFFALMSWLLPINH
jgi:hypothetical protein